MVTTRENAIRWFRSRMISASHFYHLASIIPLEHSTGSTPLPS